ncbi:SPX-domain-containing protein [Ascobolus immersus RN42]|uniref:Vacuolar transporter chaperone complex subunit 4 n=1 Tax=Ascobolus immersus RN42 TaxID=1160509 RepID=A0A3N4IV61_ASCIM|nr:SPX-domain-containing protein [Ascobolus immersus RN42]
MKFGQQLRASLIQEYFYYYISYDELKQELKTRLKQGHGSFTADDERDFLRILESELDKVHAFQKVKSGEIVRRIKVAEAEVDSLIDRLAGNFDQVDPVTEEEFLDLQGKLEDIIADVHDLDKFTQLNYVGFQKILKKHDKMTGWIIKPIFQARLNAKAFYQENYDQYIVKISQLYERVRTRGNPTQGDSSAGGSQQNFIRQTTKYWVHEDNITELKLVILKHLPVLVFDPTKPFDEKDTAITSIYYDDDKFSLYEGRLKKTEGAEAIRLRWYGGMEQDTIFVERKTHREDWTGEKSVKARFAIKEKHVNAFMKGEFTVEQVFEKMRRDKKKSPQEIENLERLAREIQYTVISRQMKPAVRSFYNRLAFQLPGDARVRISLDTQLTMIREDGWNRAGNNWRRTDIGIDWPFKDLPPGDVERFPYAVLEVKLQTHAGQEPPEWIRELVASHLVEAVPKFSKFIHGGATLFPDKIHLWPYWLPQMAIDIRKAPTHDFGIDRRMHNSSTTESDFAYSSDDETEFERTTRKQRKALTYPAADGGSSTASHGSDPNRLDEEEAVGHSAPSPDNGEYVYDSDDEIAPIDNSKKARLKLSLKRGLNSLKKVLPGSANGNATTTDPSVAGIGFGDAPIEAMNVRRIRAPPGKKIFVPVRVEPKVYFAGERTFLAWFEFAVYLGAIATTLLNFGDRLSMYAAWGFTVSSVASLIYALTMYIWRSQKIRKRAAVKYHDKWGPSVLCLLVFVSIGITVWLRWNEI